MENLRNYVTTEKWKNKLIKQPFNIYILTMVRTNIFFRNNEVLLYILEQILNVEKRSSMYIFLDIYFFVIPFNG